MTVDLPLDTACGFGGVTFGVLADTDTGTVGDWTRTPVTRTRVFPGGAGASTQVIHPGVYTATYRLLIESLADYRALQALQQTVGTLTLVEEATSMPGDVDWIFDHGYVRIADVMLMELRNPIVQVDGQVEVDALWQVAS